MLGEARFRKLPNASFFCMKSAPRPQGPATLFMETSAHIWRRPRNVFCISRQLVELGRQRKNHHSHICPHPINLHGGLCEFPLEGHGRQETQFTHTFTAERGALIQGRSFYIDPSYIIRSVRSLKFQKLETKMIPNFKLSHQITLHRLV